MYPEGLHRWTSMSKDDIHQIRYGATLKPTNTHTRNSEWQYIEHGGRKEYGIKQRKYKKR
jgi:hypothetical protein